MKKQFLRGALFLILIAVVSCNYPKTIDINDEGSIINWNVLPENPLILHPITSSINPNFNTMSTLYGNDLAMEHFSKLGSDDFPIGAIIYQVTWTQKPDLVWFGANIPGKILSVEQIIFDKQRKPMYKLYKDNKLQNNLALDTVRIKFIVSQQLAFAP